MAANLVSSIQGLASNVPATEPSATSAEVRARTRTISAAVQTVNESGVLGTGREVTFAVDPATKLPVIKVVDTSTNEIVEQWPPQYLLQIAADSERRTRDSG